MKHPKYQAMDNARQDAIPRAFERFCGDDYWLEEVEPFQPSEPIAGPIPRPTFHVFRGEQKVAIFLPNGYAECFDEKFRPLFERMREMIEDAARRAYEEFEGGGGPPSPPEQPYFPE